MALGNVDIHSLSLVKHFDPDQVRFDLRGFFALLLIKSYFFRILWIFSVKDHVMDTVQTTSVFGIVRGDKRLAHLVQISEMVIWKNKGRKYQSTFKRHSANNRSKKVFQHY
jgi:hypothetical protein